MDGAVCFVLALPMGVLASLVFGIRLCLRDTPLQRMAGWLTLKPLAATPLWALLLNVSWVRPNQASAAVLALPGVGLTVLIVLLFRAALSRQNAPLIGLLLLLDAVRWGSSAALFTSLAITFPAGGVGLLLVSLSMPLVFAVSAWVIFDLSIASPEPG